MFHQHARESQRFGLDMDDKKVVMAAVAQDGEALRYASPELKNDEEIVMAAKRMIKH